LGEAANKIRDGFGDGKIVPDLGMTGPMLAMAFMGGPPGGKGPKGKGLRRPKGRAAIKSGRGLTQQEAMDAARAGSHLKQQKSGKYSGAPDWVESPQALAKMRREYDAMLQEGGEGKGWYQRTRDWINEVTGGNKAKNDLLADELSVTSSQATPFTNKGFALRGHNAATLGKPADIVRTGQQARAINNAFPEAPDGTLLGHNGGPPLADGPEFNRIRLGKKTGQYGDRINPNVDEWGMGANDIWHARNMGYVDAEGKPWSRALTAQQHAFMDGETLRAVDRANQGTYGGHSNWTPGEVQEVPWVLARARDYMDKRGMSFDEAMAESNKTYGDYGPRYTAYDTHEAVPGVGTGHGEGMADMPEGVRLSYSNDPRSTWATAPGGRDAIYDSLGMYVRPTDKIQGAYVNPRGQLELNPAEVAKPLVDTVPDAATGGRSISPTTKEALDAASALRGYADVQNGSAWSFLDPTAKAGQKNSLFVPNDPVFKPGFSDINEVAGRHGMQAMDVGDGHVMTNFDNPVMGKDLHKASKGVAAELGIPAGDYRTHQSGTYTDYSGAFSADNAGKGIATDMLLSKLEPLSDVAKRKLDRSPLIQQGMADRAARDAELFPQMGLPIRDDIQTARQIMSGPNWIDKLKQAREAGVALPGIAVGAFGMGDEEEPGY
jgi:hypothetical protein